jgi:3-dehydrosphinganine reductase
LTTTLRYEYEPIGIHISCICPPEVKTPLVTAEYDGGNPVPIKLKQIAGSLQLDPACDGIMTGLDAGKWMFIPSFKAKATAWLATTMPGSFNAVTQIILRKVMHKHGAIKD